jgi:hypothetical protein
MCRHGPPKASERQRGGRSFPKAESTMPNEHPAKPKPMRTPAEKSSISGVVANAMAESPSA